MAVVFIIFNMLFLPAVSSFFNITCPYAHNLYLTASVKCLAVKNYACLYDSVNKNYTENCKGPSKKPPGEKSVINLGNFDTVDCSDERYQSRPFSSTQGTNCIFQKTLCNEEGQVIYSNGSTTADRKCRCDYTKSYAFVSANLTDPCSCDPVQEDCTCLIKKCNNGQKLSSDYKCVPQDERSFTCTEITHFKNGNESEGMDFRIFEENGSVINGTVLPYRTNTAIIINGFVVLIVLFMVLLCKGQRINFCLTKFKIVAGLKDVTCFAHEEVIFICEVTKEATDVKWYKDDQTILSLGNQRFEELKEKHRYILKIKNVQIIDKGHYIIKFKEKQSKAELNVFKEDYIFKIFLLLEKVAKPVVKSIFDDEFSPEKLPKELAKRYPEINDLKTEKHIKLDDFDVLYPKTDEYEIVLIYHELEYNKDLENKNSKAFSTKAKDIEKDIMGLYASARGQQKVEVLKFQPESVLVTIEISTEVNAEYNVNQIMSSAIESKTSIAGFHVCASNYVFSVIENTTYKVIVLFKLLDYTGKLGDSSSSEFVSVSKGIENSMLNLCSSIAGTNKVKVVEYRPLNQAVVVTLKLMSTYFSRTKEILGVIEDAVKKDVKPFSRTTFHRSDYIASRHVDPSSEHFDIRLMIVLLRNLVGYDIFDHLPYETVATKGADLSRIKFYRNKFFHIKTSEELITKSDFEEIWSTLALSLNRLSGNNFMKMINKLKKRKSASHTVQKVLRQRLRLEDSTDGDPIDSDDELDSDPEENKQEIMACEINKIVIKEAREKFDQEFPPPSLRQKLDLKKQVLLDYKKKKEITQTQHNLLFPKKGVPSSHNFDFPLIIRLTWELKDTINRTNHISKDDFYHMQHLDNLTAGASKLSYTDEEVDMIIKILKKLKNVSSLPYHGLDRFQDACGP